MVALGTRVPVLSPRKAETVLEGKDSVHGTRTPWSPEGRTVRSSKASVLVLGLEPDSPLMTVPAVATESCHSVVLFSFQLFSLSSSSAWVNAAGPQLVMRWGFFEPGSINRINPS